MWITRRRASQDKAPPLFIADTQYAQSVGEPVQTVLRLATLATPSAMSRAHLSPAQSFQTDHAPAPLNLSTASARRLFNSLSDIYFNSRMTLKRLLVYLWSSP